MQHLNAAPNPFYLNALRRGVLTSAQIHGSDPLSFPSPYGGGE